MTVYSLSNKPEVHKSNIKVWEVDDIRKPTSRLDDAMANMRPAASSDEQEDRMIALANELAMQQLIDGTASSQVITHFLKLGSSKERLEKEILEQQKELMAAKTEAIQSAKRIEELYNNAMEAMRRYSGHGMEEDDYE